MTDRDDRDLLAMMTELYSDDAIEQVLDGSYSVNVNEEGKE